MRNKIVRAMLLALSILFVSAPTMTAFAQSSEPEEPVVQEVGEDGTPFSVPGNGQLLDDITDDSTKQFITVQTKNNQTFFMVIDRAQSTENVYMLSLIDEYDLSEFLKDAESGTSGVVLPGTEEKNEAVPETTDTPKTEEPEEPKKDNTTSLLIMIAVIFAAAIGGGYYFKVYKPKKEAAEDSEEGIEEDEFDETYEDEEYEDESEEDAYDDEEYEDEEESDDTYEEELEEETYEESYEEEPEENPEEEAEPEDTEIEVEEDLSEETEPEETEQKPEKKRRAHGRKNRMRYQGR